MSDRYNNIFGSGPTGVLTTVLLWVVALQISTWVSIPEMHIAPIFRWVLILLFSIDAAVLLVWSHIILPPSVRAKTLITKGPYQFVRHPIYAAFIWSGTGIMAMTYKSWLLIVFVIPIHIFWVGTSKKRKSI
ncbi:MAG: hypothetical protein CM1200mP10_07030 [Candidatus Neomarinimicrobiota bacterium]|nr:MAG: hypothetical protein CM1200mP10_07030 [Candidatus Neomarinimicrobiota bacterium]